MNLLSLHSTIIVALAAACLVLGGCELPDIYSGSASEMTAAASVDAPVVVELGRTAVLEDLGATIRFVEVEEDSRCPRGWACVWEGRVRAAFLLVADGGEAAVTLEGLVDEEERDDGPAAVAGNFWIQLRALAPYPTVDPRTDTILEQGPPTATLTVTKPGAARF